MNEGHLGRFGFGGERAALDIHPAVLMHLTLSESAKTKTIPPGTVMKRVDAAETDMPAWEPYLSTDAASARPVAVVDTPCDADDTSALCLVHGGVKARLLKTGDGKELTAVQIALLAENGIYAL